MIPGMIKITYRPYTVLIIGGGTVSIRQFQARHELVLFINREVKQHEETHNAVPFVTGFALIPVLFDDEFSEPYHYIILTTAQ